MAIDYSIFPISKGTARVLDRIEKKRTLAQAERICRSAVRLRDKGKCIVPGCRERSQHLHHITYRSRGGKWRSENVCSLCPTHHGWVHAGKIQIEGNADEHLTITGDAKLLKFVV